MSGSFKGFSLVEFLIVLSLAFAATGLSIYFWGAIVGGTAKGGAGKPLHLQNVAELFAADLRLARAKSIANNKDTFITATSNISYLGYSDTNGNGIYDSDEEIILSRSFSDYAAGIHISVYNGDFCFKSNGQSGTLVRSITVKQASTNKTATISINSGQGVRVRYE